MLKHRPSFLVSQLGTQLRGAFLLSAGVLLLSFLASMIPITSTQAASLPVTPGMQIVAQSPLEGLSGMGSDYGSNTSTCAIETVGWVICPVMRSIARVADYGFAFINQNFLQIEYDIRSTDSGVFIAWSTMRTVANVLFVLAIMILIYMQITGKVGGAFNLKRILPRLLIVAFLVNVSYYICLIFIEGSNIIGNGIISALQQVTSSVGQPAMSLTSAANNFNDSRLTDITNGILQKSGTVWILLAPVAAVTVSIAVICAIGLVLLIMRKVVVAMLVLISPIIIVLYLLPNTERFFQQWSRLFFQLLLLYPVIAFLLGTGQIISATIITVGSGGESNYRVQDDSYRGRNGGSGSATTDLAAAGAAVLPLLGVVFIMKTLSTLATSTGSRVAGSLGSKRSKAQEEKLKARLEGKQATQPGSLGKGLPSYDRRPAFTRLRRKRGIEAIGTGAAAAGTSGTGKPGSASKAASEGGASMFDRMTGNVNKPDAAANADQKLEDANEAKIAEAEAAGLNGAVAVKDDEKEKGKTAKDIFNNMNKSHQAGGGSSGGGANSGGNGGEGGQKQPTAPTNDYRAPTISQSHNTGSTGASAPQQNSGGAQPTIIAVPVQVDASTFLNKNNNATNTPGSSTTQPGMTQPPTSDIEKKAKARAQKYIFDSATKTEEAEAKLEAIQELKKQENESEKGNKDER